MSKAALSELVRDIEESILSDRGKKGDEMAIKVFRRSDTNRYANAFRLRKTEFRDQVLAQLTEANIKLGPLDNVRIKALCDKYFERMKTVLVARGRANKLMEVYEGPDEVTLVSWMRRDLSNFDALTQQTTGSKAVLRREVLQPFMVELNDLLGKMKKAPLKEAFTENFELGHQEGSNVQYFVSDKLQRAVSGVVGNDTALREQVLEDVDAALQGTRHKTSVNETRSILIDANAKFHNTNSDDLKKVITISIESKLVNAKKDEDRGVREELVKELRKFVNTRPAEQWVNQEASDSVARATAKRIMQDAMKIGAVVDDKSLLRAIDTKSNKASKRLIKKNKTVIPVRGISPKVKAAKTKTARPEATRSYLDLRTLISSRLPPTVMKNMRAPGLRNRSGRFAASTRITGIEQTPQGFPSIAYSYQRDPYDVFDRTVGKAPWNTPERDPRQLVEKSIREIATEIGMGRFYTRRV